MTAALAGVDVDEATYRAFVRILSTRRPGTRWTVDDVRDEISAAQIPPQTLGQHVRAAAVAGLLHHTGTTVPSRQREARGRRLSVFVVTTVPARSGLLVPEGGRRMGLPWVRLDSNIASHDKVLALLSDPSTGRWQAFTSFICSLGWSGGQGTDGYIPTYALGSIHGNAKTARLLVKYGLWDEAIAGYRIHNFESRQELAAVSAGKRASQQVGAAKGNCVRWHGKDCGCWRETTGATG